ncbi:MULTISPECIES: CBS domain-containing protein [unclassified Dehalobacter]|uniref:CBS domain-containing protein n=1 Tax=unclassified Dehalobacter TaxID=2635733 RepID=UPI000E6BF7EB|nr:MULTISPECIES: CBS domain-containing protein [unclassified Dehalobacter]RJE48313.1 CBS domain-containing protein [Dehalobacter sp. MCB1]TCX50380.1 CBS domain-containing protein [Dehalobacter sp. 14DCB1]TCX52380.1 CBS domain-containing protein [Dehalobacter sp. 12DCB1]
MRVMDIMSTDVSWVDPATKVPDIAKMMRDKDIGAVPVVQAGRVLGIITDRDIVLRVIASDKDVKQATAEQCMTADPICIDGTQDIDTVAEVMAEYQVKRLPVLKQGQIVGVIALGDLAIENIHINEAGEALNGISRGISH